MGADQFHNRISAKTAREAFTSLVEEARYEHGHGGYTGTIAEKNDFKMVSVPAGRAPLDFIDEAMDDDQGFWDDKYGPAACVDAGPDPKDPSKHIFHFFGWASS